MNERFIKFIPSEEAFWLLHNKPNAFRLLAHIANTSRRYNGHPDGLIIGQCHLQNWTKYNLTERQYRTAKLILVQRSYIKIIETNRTRQKSTTGTTTGSTLVQILDSRIWDINPESKDDRIADRETTERRQTRKKKKEEEKEIQPQTPSFQKTKFRENVQLTQTEFDSLLAKHGKDFLDRMLDALDSYKGSTGKQYKSDFHTMKAGGWVIERVMKDLQTPKQKTFSDYSTNELLGKKLEDKYLNGSSGWMCVVHHDIKKDDKGLLFHTRAGSAPTSFISFSNGAFKEEVLKLLKTKNMGEFLPSQVNEK
jgi:hypothetical protein